MSASAAVQSRGVGRGSEIIKWETVFPGDGAVRSLEEGKKVGDATGLLVSEWRGGDVDPVASGPGWPRRVRSYVGSNTRGWTCKHAFSLELRLLIFKNLLLLLLLF